MRARRIATICAIWVVITPYAAALTQVPPNSGSSSGETELHTYLEQAAEAMHKGDNAAAEGVLRRALKIDPHSLAALNNLGIVLARMGRPAEAIPFYEDALRFHPDDSSTKRNLAVAYFKAQHYRSALSLLRPMAVASPSDFQIQELAGLCQFALDRYPEAARYLERANQAEAVGPGRGRHSR